MSSNNIYGDFNNDSIINIKDLNILLSEWNNNFFITDLNNLLTNWKSSISRYQLVMKDSYGDGWNGSKFYIENLSGIKVTDEFTFTNGYEEVSPFFTLIDNCYNIICETGYYPREISWDLKKDDNIILSGGANYVFNYKKTFVLPTGEDITPPLTGPDNTININVAFHMIRNEGDPLWNQTTYTFNNETINDDGQILKQIEVLNDAFSTTSASMKPIDDVHYTPGGTNMKINFNLLTGPNSNGHNYYNLRYLNSTEQQNYKWTNFPFGDPSNSILSTINENSASVNLGVSFETTCNIYCSSVNNGLLGFAAFPSNGIGGTAGHGVWLLTNTLPGGNVSNYNGGNTLVHEIGHYLNLYHTFKEGDAIDDFCDDTPKHETNNGSYLDVNGNPYPNDSTNIPDTDINNSGRDPVYNYMNYTFDNTMSRFTDDQCYRMWLSIKEYLPDMWGNNSNLLIKNQEDLTKVDISFNNIKQNLYQYCRGNCGTLHPITFEGDDVNIKKLNFREQYFKSRSNELKKNIQNKI